MPCSKFLATKIPISVRLKIPKEKLLCVKQKEKWFIKSESLEIQELAGVLYRVGICSFEYMLDENISGQCIFVYLVVEKKEDLKMNVDYEISVPSANYIGKKGELQIGEKNASMEMFLSSQISPTNVCKIVNASIFGNSIKLHKECFEYLFICNQKKMSVSDLDILDKDFALKLMKASFALFPMLHEREEPPETEEVEVEAVEEVEVIQAPQIRKPFVKKVAGIFTLMFIACSCIVAFLITSPLIQELLRFTYPRLYNKLFNLIELIMACISVNIPVVLMFLQRLPYKWILLPTITSIGGCVIAIYISQFTAISVIFALLVTLFVLAFLILYASFTRMDYTNFGKLVFGVLCLLFAYPSLSFAFDLIPWIPQIYYFLCALISMFAFVMNVQKIFGTFEVIADENEPYISAITIFQNIFQMFLFILGVFGGDGVENFVLLPLLFPRLLIF